MIEAHNLLSRVAKPIDAGKIEAIVSKVARPTFYFLNMSRDRFGGV